MTLRPIQLKDLAIAANTIAAPSAPSQADLDAAHARGVAEATAEAAAREAAHAQAQAGLLEAALASLRADIETLRAALEQDMMTVLDTLLERVLSELAYTASASLVMQEVRKILDRAGTDVMTVRVGGDVIPAECAPEGIVVEADPDLRPGQATIALDSARYALDLPTLISDMRSTLALPSRHDGDQP